MPLVGLGGTSWKSKTQFASPTIWLQLYEIWERERSKFLSVAKDRNCPLCGASARRHLWATQDGYEYVLCSECAMVYSTPTLSYDQWRDYLRKNPELGKLNSSLAESRLSSENLKDDHRKFASYIRRIRRFKASGQLLDVGCFTGNFVKQAMEYGFDSFGVDYYQEAIEKGQALHRLSNLRQGIFEEVAPSLLRSGEKYDVITFWETFEHMLFPSESLRYSNQLLRPGGLVAITVPNFDCLHVRLLRSECFHCLGGPGNSGHMNMFTESTLKTMAKQNSFETIHFETEAGTDYADVINYLNLDFQKVNSYRSNLGLERPKKSTSTFLAPPFLDALLFLSPLWRTLEIAFDKGALLFIILRKNKEI